MKVITAWDEANNIRVLYKKNGKRKIRTISDFKWYFAVSHEDFEKIDSELLDKYYHLNEINTIVKEKNIVKIYSDSSFRCQNFRNALKKLNIVMLEADLNMWKRYLVDTDTEIETDLSILFFDIETDDSHQGIEIGRDQILSWSGCDSNGKIYFHSGDEKEMLEELVRTIHQYDIFCGWNSGKFDLPYVQKRMDFHGIAYDWRKRIHVDLMQRSIKVYNYDMDKIGLTGFSLDEMSRVFLKKRKIKFDGSITELYNNDFEKFKKYNIRDSVLLYELNKKLGIIDLMIKECKWTGTLLNKFYVGEILDNYILRQSKKYNMYMPTRPTFDEASLNKEIKIIGGYVQKPTTGLYSNVWIFDYKALYPSIIISWNIGADSLNLKLSKQGDTAFNKFIGADRKIEDVNFSEWYKFLMKEKKRLDPNDEHYQTANNNFFKKNIKSLTAMLLKELLKQRQEIKNKLKDLKIGSAEYGNVSSSQGIIKELANSMYGINADRTARYFNKNIAESITITGQFLNKTSFEILESLGHEVIYGDTDSLFSVIDNKEDIEKITEVTNEKLIKFFSTKFKLTTITIYLENEKKYRKLIMVDKKRYTGMLEQKDNPKKTFRFSRGLEDVKKNTIILTKEKMIELTSMLTSEDKTLIEIKRWLRKLKEYVLTNKKITPDMITIKTRISKPIHKYKAKAVHVKLAEKLIKEGKLLEVSESKYSWGNQIKYIMTDTTNGQEAILASEYNGKWDRKYYWDVQVYAPIMRVLKAVWPKENWEEHSIILFEKIQQRKEREAKKIERKKEQERKKAERLKKKSKKQQKLKFVKD